MRTKCRYGNSCLTGAGSAETSTPLSPGSSALTPLSSGSSAGVLFCGCWGMLSCFRELILLSTRAYAGATSEPPAAPAFFVRRRKYHTIATRAMRNAPPSPTPAPTPTFVSWDNPELDKAVAEGVGGISVNEEVADAVISVAVPVSVILKSPVVVCLCVSSSISWMRKMFEFFKSHCEDTIQSKVVFSRTLAIAVSEMQKYS